MSSVVDAAGTQNTAHFYETAISVPMAQEFYLFFFFCCGFTVFRSHGFQRLLRPASPSKSVMLQKPGKETEGDAPVKIYSACSMHDDLRQGNYEQVVSAWSQLGMKQFTVDALCMVVQALMALGRFPEICGVITQAASEFPERFASAVHEVIETIDKPDVEVSRQQVTAVLRSILKNAREVLDVQATETLLFAIARSNDEACVDAALQRLASLGAPAYSGTLACVAQAFLANNNWNEALKYLQCAFTAELEPGELCQVPSRLVVDVAKAVTQNDMSACCSRTMVLMDLLESVDEVPPDAFVAILESAVKQSPPNQSLAHRVERQLRARSRQHDMPIDAHNALLRMHLSAAGDGEEGYLGKVAAARCFDELVDATANLPSNALNEDTLLGMLELCLDNHKVHMADHIFNYARRSGKCSAQVFSAIIKVLAASEDHQRICALSEVLETENFELDAATLIQLSRSAAQCGMLDVAKKVCKKVDGNSAQNYIGLIRACGKEKNVTDAMDLFRDLQARGEADISAHNCLLDICVSVGDTHSAQSLFKEMQASGHVDAASYNILMKQPPGCETVASPADASAVLEEMRGCGLKPNAATYNSFINQLLQRGDFARAWETVSELEAGPGADHYTVSILFKGYRRERQVMDPKAFDRTIALMDKRKVKVDEVLINAALEACAALRDSARLSSCLQTFARCGWSVPKQCNVHAYGILIKAYGQSRRIDLVWKLWTEATEERGLTASEQLYGQMIDALVSNDHLDDALELLQDMKSHYGNRLESQGFSVAYAMIIRGYAQRRDCGRALECYEEMKSLDMKVGLVVFNTLIDACSRVGDMDAASQLFQDMTDSNCSPDLITYSTLIKGYCFLGDMDKAMELFELMRKKGFTPDAIVFNSVLDGAAKQQMPGLCEQVFEEMVAAGVSPSNHSASILIKLHGRCRNVDAAFNVIDDMPQKYGFQLNTATYTCLMTTCIANGQLHKALGLRERMVKDGCLPDSRTYSTLLRGTLKANNVEQCLATVRAALKQGGVRNLLEADLVQSVLCLLQRRRGWDAQSQELFDQLRRSGLHIFVPTGNNQDPGQRHSHMRARGETGTGRRDSGNSPGSGGSCTSQRRQR